MSRRKSSSQFDPVGDDDARHFILCAATMVASWRLLRTSVAFMLSLRFTNALSELLSRRQALSVSGSVLATTFSPLTAFANVSDEQIKEVVIADLKDRHFLVTGDLTKSIYRPTATFTDEIDTYGLDQWQKGTSRLFVAKGSDVRLVGDILVSPKKVEFRFDEDLMFNIPFRPVVSLTGKVELKRDAEGFITRYQEFWDQDVATVLKSAKFGK